MNDDSSENKYSEKEKLTILIATIFDEIGKEAPHILRHDDNDLRGAFERYFYFDSLVNPERINLLLNASSLNELQNQDAHVRSIVHDFYQLYGNLDFLSYCKNFIFRWLRVLSDLFKTCAVNDRKIVNEQSGEMTNRTIGFFFISKRFIDFFEHFSNLFSKDKQVYFSTSSKLLYFVNIPIFRMRLALLKKFCVMKKHPFFSVYLRVVLQYQLIYSALERRKPDVLIFAEGTSYQEYCAAVAAKNLKIPTVRLQSGRASILHSGYINMPFDRMLYWGEGFLKHYKSVTPSSMHVVCGSPVIDSLLKVRKKNSKRFVVAVLTQPADKGWITQEHYEHLVVLVIRLLEENPDIDIIVRMHPVDTNNIFFSLARSSKRLKIFNSPRYSIADVFSKADCMVSFASTTISEAAACSVIPIILATNAVYSLFPYPEKEGAALVSDSIDKAFEYITRLHLNPEIFDDTRHNMEMFSEKFFGSRDGKSLQRIRDEIYGAFMKESGRECQK